MPSAPSIRLPAPVSRRQLPDMVGESLMRYIQSHCESGDLLPSEAKLCSTLGVSKGPLREALGALEMMGVVEKRNGSGTYVTTRWHELLSRPISWGLFDRGKTMAELVEARILFEMPMAELTLQRVTPAELLVMEEHVVVMENVDDRDEERFMEADLQFHLVMAAGTQNRVLADFMNIARSMLRRDQLHLLGIHSREQLRITAAVHREILETLKARDGAGVRVAMERHCVFLRHYLVDRGIGAPPVPPHQRYFHPAKTS